MRPLARMHAPPRAAAERPAFASLMNAYGPYCAISERPLHEMAHAWHAGSQAEVSRVASPADWGELLLLDADTYAAAQGAEAAGADTGLMLPHRDLTFALDESSPFTYALEDVAVVQLDDNGQPLGATTTEPLAIVRAHDPRAQATIDRFALNSAYFDQERSTLRIPRSAYLSMQDQRLFERTLAWQRADQVAASLAGVDGATRQEPLVAQLRLLAAATGFWSVWATVLWRRFHDKELLRRVLAEPEARTRRLLRLRAESTAVPADAPIGPGSHNAFPGTRIDWLD